MGGRPVNWKIKQTINQKVVKEHKHVIPSTVAYTDVW